jgi:hypothetical protein
MSAEAKEGRPGGSLVAMSFRFGFQTSRQTAATLSSVSMLLTGILITPALLLTYFG